MLPSSQTESGHIMLSMSYRDSSMFHSPYMAMQLMNVMCQKQEHVKKVQTIRRQQLKRLKRTLRLRPMLSTKSLKRRMLQPGSEDVEIICNSILLLLIHLKTLRIVWGLDEAVHLEVRSQTIYL